MRRLSWVFALMMVFSACKKEGAPAASGGEGSGAAPARSAGEGQGSDESGPYSLTREKLEAFMGYQRRMLTVHENVQKELQGVDARILQGGGSDVTKERLKVIEGKAKAEEEARREAGLSEEEVNRIAGMVTAVISQRHLSRQMGLDEEVRKLQDIQARLPPEQQKELAPQMAQQRQRAQELEDLTELRRTYGEANVELLLTREQELTQAYQDMLKTFSGTTQK